MQPIQHEIGDVGHLRSLTARFGEEFTDHRDNLRIGLPAGHHFDARNERRRIGKMHGEKTLWSLHRVDKDLDRTRAKWTGRMPSCIAMGTRMGASRMTVALVFMIIPMKMSRTFTSMRNVYLFRVIPRINRAIWLRIRSSAMN